MRFFSTVKCRFLRVGGPAWELKIDAERLQETEKNEEEEESETRREKVHTYGQKRVHQTIF